MRKMATLFSRSTRTLPLIAGAATVSLAGATLIATRKPLLLDSNQNTPTKTFSFPTSMLLSRQLTVSTIEQLNHDTKCITFNLPGGTNEISGVPAGAAILTQHTPAGRWFPVLRPYTPVSATSDHGTLQLVVKEYPNGTASKYMHSLTPGAKITVRGPIPGYAYKPSPDAAKDVLFIAGGAGITPVYSLARGILSDSTDKTRIQLVWGVNGTRDIVLGGELEALEKAHPERLRVTYCVSGPEGKPEAPSLGDVAKFKKGYVDKNVLAEVMARSQGTLGDAQGKKVWVCGPPGMQDKLTSRSGGVLAELGIQKGDVHVF